MSLLIILSWKQNRSSNPAGDMEVDLEEVVLSDSGAAGAIVHGLEDEFFEVCCLSPFQFSQMFV